MRSPFQVLVIPFRRSGNGEWEFAVFKRSDGDYWQFVAGGGEDRETPLQTARREAEEEARISPDSEYLPLDSMSTVPVAGVTGEYTWGRDVLVIPEHCLGVHVEERTLVLSKEHTEYVWARYEEALALLKWDSNRNALWELNERLKREQDSKAGNAAQPEQAAPLSVVVIRNRMNIASPDEYDAFASDYHWLYSDQVLSGEPFLEKYKSLLGPLPSDAKILDCACGIGIHALALARDGYSVEGTDASPGMVDQARSRAKAKGLGVPFMTCSWAKLPGNFHRRFDLAFCCGNAIGHCKNADEMVTSLRGVRSALKPGAVLVLNSRNWEKLRIEKPRFSPMTTRIRDGKRCIPLYVWNFPRRWEGPHVVELVLLFQQDDRVDLTCYPITYYPFRYGELVKRLKEAGFCGIQSDYEKTKDDYTVIAKNE